MFHQQISVVQWAVVNLTEPATAVAVNTSFHNFGSPGTWHKPWGATCVPPATWRLAVSATSLPPSKCCVGNYWQIFPWSLDWKLVLYFWRSLGRWRWEDTGGHLSVFTEAWLPGQKEIWYSGKSGGKMGEILEASRPRSGPSLAPVTATIWSNLHNTALHCTAPRCTALYCIALHYTSLHVVLCSAVLCSAFSCCGWHNDDTLAYYRVSSQSWLGTCVK